MYIRGAIPGLAAVSSDAIIARKSDVLKRYLAAVNEGIEATRKDPKAAAAALGKVSPGGPAQDVVEAQVPDIGTATFTSMATGGGGPSPPTATSIELVEGNNQTAPAGTVVPIRPAVRVRDQAGAPIAGIPVTFVVTGGDGSVQEADQLTDADGLGLVPVTNKSITEFYPNVEMPAKTYPWQTKAVPTVAVKSVLVSFDFRRLDCENVGRFAQILASNMGWLSDNGHPKWKTVQLDYPLKGWEQYDCVKKYLAKSAPAPAPAKSSSELNPVLDAIKNILKD